MNGPTPEQKLEAGIAICPSCKHKRPVAALKLDDSGTAMVCEDGALCRALRDRTPGPNPIRVGNPIDYSLLPDPPLVSRTTYHRTRRSELASVSVDHSKNGHSKNGGKR